MVTELEHINLRPFNTFRIDAECRLFVEYTSKDDIPAVVAKYCKGSDFLCIGGGSNLLFVSDYPGTILHSRILDVTMEQGESDKIFVTAGSGVVMDDLILSCARSGIWGLENLSGIPGEVGAAAVQNVGAYGVEAGNLIHSVECYDIKAGKFKTILREECEYGYRHSMFKLPENKFRYIIYAVRFELSANPCPHVGYGSLSSEFPDKNTTDLTPLEIRDTIIRIRNNKLPIVDETGSAGSFFKNPIVSEDIFTGLSKKYPNIPHYHTDSGVKIPAAWLIDNSGLKGICNGGACVWEKQPLVIVNKTGKAKADDIIGLENRIILTVKAKYGITLHPEVEHVDIKTN